MKMMKMLHCYPSLTPCSPTMRSSQGGPLNFPAGLRVLSGSFNAQGESEVRGQSGTPHREVLGRRSQSCWLEVVELVGTVGVCCD